MCVIELIEFTSWWNALKEEDLHGTRVTAGELNEPMEDLQGEGVHGELFRLVFLFYCRARSVFNVCERREQIVDESRKPITISNSKVFAYEYAFRNTLFVIAYF